MDEMLTKTQGISVCGGSRYLSQQLNSGGQYRHNQATQHIGRITCDLAMVHAGKQSGSIPNTCGERLYQKPIHGMFADLGARPVNQESTLRLRLLRNFWTEYGMKQDSNRRGKGGGGVGHIGPQLYSARVQWQ